LSTVGSFLKKIICKSLGLSLKPVLLLSHSQLVPGSEPGPGQLAGSYSV